MRLRGGMRRFQRPFGEKETFAVLSKGAEGGEDSRGRGEVPE